MTPSFSIQPHLPRTGAPRSPPASIWACDHSGMLSGTRAYSLLAHVLAEIEPHLPAGVHIKITAHRRWTTIQRADRGSIKMGPIWMSTDDRGLPKAGHVVGVRALGAWIPFLPRDLRRRLVAQDAAETLLDLGYQNLSMRSSGMRVEAATTANGVVVSFVSPDRPDERITLDPIPFALL